MSTPNSKGGEQSNWRGVEEGDNDRIGVDSTSFVETELNYSPCRLSWRSVPSVWRLRVGGQKEETPAIAHVIIVSMVFGVAEMNSDTPDTVQINVQPLKHGVEVGRD